MCPQRERRVKPHPSPEDNPVVFVDRYLEKHITPVTFKSNIKRNPLYSDMRSVEPGDYEKAKPSWTVKEYDTQTVNSNLATYLKVMWGKEEEEEDEEGHSG